MNEIDRETAVQWAKENCPYMEDELRGAFYDGFIKGIEREYKNSKSNAGLIEALKIARNYVEAVCFNTPNPKKRNNYADCLTIIDAALAKHEASK